MVIILIPLMTHLRKHRPIDKNIGFFRRRQRKREETTDRYIYSITKLSLRVWQFVLLIPLMTYLPGFALQGQAELGTWLGHIRGSKEDNIFFIVFKFVISPSL